MLATMRTGLSSPPRGSRQASIRMKAGIVFLATIGDIRFVRDIIITDFLRPDKKIVFSSRGGEKKM